MVLNGVDTLGFNHKLLSGKRLGLITSVSGVDRQLESTLRILYNRYNLVALYSPEHGVRGDIEAGGMVETYRDPFTGLPVHSLYRADSKRLAQEMVQGVDSIVYDIQDVGTRYYTFISTLLYALEDCARFGLQLIVLDRQNPLGGEVVEGNLLDSAYTSFVGAYPLPIRYGLTAGEFASMVNQELALGCDLEVVPCQNWDRKMLFPQTGLTWVMPSLGIPRFETALLYPGMCLVEGTNLSEGRGTSCPFEITGAPFIKAQVLCDEMNSIQLPGVRFTPVHFKPHTSKHVGINCGGVHAHVTNPFTFRSVQTGIELLGAVQKLYPQDFQFLPAQQHGHRAFIEYLAGGDLLTNQTSTTVSILTRCRQESAGFAIHKRQYHLYP